MAQSVVVGGSGGLGIVIARQLAARGRSVVVTSRDPERARAAAQDLGGDAVGLAVDLTAPASIEAALSGIGEVDALVITAVEQTVLTIADFDVDEATRAATVKLVGYPEVVRVLHGRFTPAASVVLFGGVAKDRPYPGSTMVTATNSAVTGLVRTLAAQIAPHRINAIHPGIVGDSPKWREVANHPHLARTPIGRLVTMDEIASATGFLLDNAGVNAQELVVDGGMLIS